MKIRCFCSYISVKVVDDICQRESRCHVRDFSFTPLAFYVVKTSNYLGPCHPVPVSYVKMATSPQVNNSR
jgi:hypothetical protein